ncbi:hypothetical protein TL16_g01534 [Triparma laevis f. inornata]|uniref:Cytochrome c domain-containing protein n=2 Tax=Triparma laevis TaxID=1534972 RepID=A0A9W7EAA3_9STRA|nr:hypothetical protein TL16_g01534 [Triparma laevis f. inornata]GMH68698.1 hypothetical protein TrLO_g1793 [Triparma laevis f. longispina]
MLGSRQALHRVALGATSLATLGLLTTTTSKSSDDHIPSLGYAWTHTGFLDAFDAKAVRRGYQVYKEVCATCHSLEKIHFRELEGKTHSKEELIAMAAEIDVVDGPNDEGEMFERPGKLSDPLPKPYANEEAGRAANGGALPPDLSLMAKARHGGVDYIFALLTGYCDAPAGKVMLPGLYYNPYFAGGAIAMPPPLQDGQVEYADGTPATMSQMSRDVSVFLNWAAEPEHDERKLQGFKYLTVLGLTLAVTGYYKRFRWSTLKTRKISYVN